MDAETAKKATHLGTIRVVVCRVRYLGVSPTQHNRKGPSEIDSVSEKALKGRSLSARTGYVIKLYARHHAKRTRKAMAHLKSPNITSHTRR
jgi:hypothetical protein